MVSLFCPGIVVKYAIEVANIIFRKVKKKIKVIDMHTNKPIDWKAVIEYSCAVTP